MRVFLAACLLSAAASIAGAFDWPITLNFQLGFHLQVLPGPDDLSGPLGLVVAPDRVVNDKTKHVSISGTITNFSDEVRENVQMRVAVTSYVGTGVSLGVTTVEPATIPPGGVAHFVSRVSLDDPRPRHALYTVTADFVGVNERQHINSYQE